MLHLVRAGNDPAALASFVGSYEQHAAGSPHRLVFLLKGFAAEVPPDLRRLLERVPHDALRCPDRGFDIGSYFHAAGQLRSNLLLCVNSYSAFRADGWLAKLADAYHRPGVGLVGAMGSNESLTTSHWQRFAQSQGGILPWVLGSCRALALHPALLTLFPAFPNAHVRTNGFLIARSDFLATRPGMLRTKLDAWRFESGRASLTRQVLRRGLQVRIVGASGESFAPDRWHQSGTFWQSRQENLLIGDNRTGMYDRAEPAQRRQLSAQAWGNAAP